MGMVQKEFKSKLSTFSSKRFTFSAKISTFSSDRSTFSSKSSLLSPKGLLLGIRPAPSQKFLATGLSPMITSYKVLSQGDGEPVKRGGGTTMFSTLRSPNSRSVCDACDLVHERSYTPRYFHYSSLPSCIATGIVTNFCTSTTLG